MYSHISPTGGPLSHTTVFDFASMVTVTDENARRTVYGTPRRRACSDGNARRTVYGTTETPCMQRRQRASHKIRGDRNAAHGESATPPAQDMGRPGRRQQTMESGTRAFKRCCKMLCASTTSPPFAVLLWRTRMYSEGNMGGVLCKIFGYF